MTEKEKALLTRVARDSDTAGGDIDHIIEQVNEHENKIDTLDSELTAESATRQSEDEALYNQILTEKERAEKVEKELDEKIISGGGENVYIFNCFYDFDKKKVYTETTFNDLSDAIKNKKDIVAKYFQNSETDISIYRLTSYDLDSNKELFRLFMTRDSHLSNNISSAFSFIITKGTNGESNISSSSYSLQRKLTAGQNIIISGNLISADTINDTLTTSTIKTWSIDGLKKWMGQPMKYRGVLNTIAELNNLASTEKVQGYIYSVTETANNYIYTQNNQWEVLSPSSIDLSNYYTKSATDTLLNKKQDKLTAGDNVTITDNTISANQINDNNLQATTTTLSSSKINSIIDNKVTKIDNDVDNIVYAKKAGIESSYKVSDTLNNKYIPVRNDAGTFEVGTPTADKHPATKKYVDDNLPHLYEHIINLSYANVAFTIYNTNSKAMTTTDLYNYLKDRPDMKVPCSGSVYWSSTTYSAQPYVSATYVSSGDNAGGISFRGPASKLGSSSTWTARSTSYGVTVTEETFLGYTATDKVTKIF